MDSSELNSNANEDFYCSSSQDTSSASNVIKHVVEELPNSEDFEYTSNEGKERDGDENDDEDHPPSGDPKDSKQDDDNFPPSEDFNGTYDEFPSSEDFNGTDDDFGEDEDINNGEYDFPPSEDFNGTNDGFPLSEDFNGTISMMFRWFLLV